MILDKIVGGITDTFGNWHVPYTNKIVTDDDVDCAHLVIKEGDIILTRTLGHMSSIMNSAYWKHAAIYIGNGTAIEAVKPVVRYRRLSGLLYNTDYFCILGMDGISEEDRKKVIDTSISFVDTPYDFPLDVDDIKKVYCSELVYHSYREILNLEVYLEKVLWKWTFSPQRIFDLCGIYFNPIMYSSKAKEILCM